LWYQKLQDATFAGQDLMTLQVNITSNGRMSLPVGIRKRLGLEGGGAVLVEETSDGVILRTVDQAVAKAQAIAKRYAQHPDAAVDAFLATRRAESGE
jgi:AbrB family looped-hinge helix DNA binding protein